VSPDGRSLYTGSVRSCDQYDCYGSTAVARFDRNPNTGALTYRGCITGDKRSGPSGSGACTAISSATREGNHSGLDGGTLASSPDGKTLYVGGSDVARLQRNTSAGELSYQDCITGDKRSGPSGSGACDAIPSATKDGSRSGLSGNALAASPDGKTLFAGGHSEVARLDRDPATGALKFRDCVTGFKLSGPSGTGACDAIPSATEGGRRTASRAGARSGLGNGILALTPSPDGASLYSASCCYYDGSLVARFGFAPQTRIAEDRTHGHKAVFRFRAGKLSTFECKLRGRRVKPKLEQWRSCGSEGFQRKGRKVYRGLRTGSKVFRVRATDELGNTDPTEAKRRWQVA
jgi:hypothetical protein